MMIFFLRKFFNPHLPPFQVSNRPYLEFEVSYLTMNFLFSVNDSE